MKTKFFITLPILAFSFLTSHSQNWVWATGAGGTSYDIANDIFTDAAGNSYITGWFQNTVNFGPDTLTSSGGYDFFVAKYNTAGICQWAQSAGSSMNDIGYGVVANSSGDIYVTGTYYNTVLFGTNSVTSSGGADVFVAKYNSSGVCQWATSGGAPVFNEQGQAIALDAAGNVLINGYFMGSATFGTSTFTSFGSSDVFTAKLNSSGAWQWAVQGGSANGDNGYGVSCDANNNVYITGYFRSTASFGSQNISSSGLEDMFVVKYNASGVCQWAQKAGGGDNDHGNGIVSDAAGNTYITGWFTSGTMAFGSINIAAPNASSEGFIAKYNSNGIPVWAFNVGSASIEGGTGICLDNTGSPVISGTFNATFTVGTSTLTAAGGGDFFAAKFNNTTGANIWAIAAGGSGADVAYKISADGTGNVYTAGNFTGTCNYGSNSTVSTGLADIFLAKINTFVSVAEQGNDPGLTLFPNPAISTLSLDLDYDGSALFFLYTASGCMCREFLVQPGFNTISLADLPAGIYLYRVIGENRFSRSGKLIIEQ